MKLNPSTKVYLKQFLFIAIGFSIILLSLALIMQDEFNLWEMLFEILFISVLTSFTTVSLYLKEFKKKEIAITDESLSVKHSEEISSGISEEKLIKTLENDSFFSKMKIEKTAKGVKLKSGFSWTSWGEKVRILIHNSEQKVTIFSKPVLPFVIMDNGRNKYNVDRAAYIINAA